MKSVNVYNKVFRSSHQYDNIIKKACCTLGMGYTRLSPDYVQVSDNGFVVRFNVKDLYYIIDSNPEAMNMNLVSYISKYMELAANDID